jgi:hypothetical protein
MRVSRAISVGFGVLLVFGVLGCNPSNEDEGEYVRGASGKADQASRWARYFHDAVLLTTPGEIAVKLRDNRSPIGLDVYDQYMLTLGQRTPAVTKHCSSDLNEDCPLDVSGFKAFRNWLHQRLVIGPNIPEAMDRSRLPASLVKKCDAQHGVRCGVSTLLSVLKVYVRDLAAVDLAFHASRVKSLGDDLERLKLSATGVNFSNGAPSYILNTRVQVASLRNKYPDLFEVECEPPKPDKTCYVSPGTEVEAHQMSLYSVSASVSGLARGLEIDNKTRKEYWFAPLTKNIDYLGVNAYQVVDCKPQKDPNNQGKKTYPRAPKSPIWELYHSKDGKILPEINTANAIAVPQLRSVVDSKGLDALAATVSFSPTVSIVTYPKVYARTVVVGIKKTATSTSSHAHASEPFCKKVF